jgi:lipid II:glycine glycyltransferase (peptidoglycan interpeptide bridge formation enzyme)
LEKRCRTKIRKALKNGYTGDVRQAETRDLVSGGDFRRLYDGTMHRLGAAPAYLFSDEYYQQLLAGLGSDLLIAEVRDPKGVVAASSLVMRHADRVHGHLAGSSVEDAPMGTNNLLKWIVMEFVLDQGLRQFHLGGGVGPDDSLFRFKRSFGGRELRYDVSGLVLDDDSYQSLVQRRAKECDTTPDALLTSSFFPAYRGGAA